MARAACLPSYLTPFQQSSKENSQGVRAAAEVVLNVDLLIEA
jgi:hypothetical protein